MNSRFSLIAALAIALLGSHELRAADQPKLDTAQIDKITGLKGTLNQEEGVFKVSAPRVDVKVTVDGTALPPFMGLTTWAAFMADPKGDTMVMGDLVLFEDEVNPVMSVLFEKGLNVTALHNHFFFSRPQVFFMHIGGQGPTDQLAAGVRAALDQVRQVRSASSEPAQSFTHAAVPMPSSISADDLAAIIGGKPAVKDGMAKFVIGRSVSMPCGCQVGKEMGVNTWAAFMGNDETALVDGDFVTVAGELQPVLHALRSGGVNIVAIHSHMEDETPKLIYLHYWGIGKAQDLAKTLRKALDVQAASGASETK